MSHYLKKYNADTWQFDENIWGEDEALWGDESTPFSSLIQAAFNKYYWLQPGKTAQDWSWIDSEDGNDVQFYCPQTVNLNDLEIGSFYYIYSQHDLINPIAAFELHDIQTEYSPAKDSPYVYKCTGKTWRSILDTDGIVVRLSESKISFRNLCRKLLEQINAGHPAFSPDDSFIDDDNYIFSSYKARAYALAVIQDIESYGYKIWFDSNLRMHAVKNAVSNTAYTITSVISPSRFQLNTTEGVKVGDRFEFGKIICRIKEVSGSNILIDKALSLSAPQQIFVTSSYVIDWDWDNKLSEKQLSEKRNNRPVAKFLVTADSVISTNTLTDSFTATGLISDSIYTLSKKSSEPSRVFIAFDKQTEVDENFDFIPIGGSGDTVSNGRLQVNLLPAGNFLNHFRNYKNPIDANGGIVLGASIAINRNFGELALLGIKAAPADSPNDYLAGFLVEDTELKIIYQGLQFDTGFPLLIPTIKRSVLSIDISGSTSNVFVDNTDEVYKVGQTVLFQLNSEAQNFATITAVSSNFITVDKNISFASGLEVFQQADYILKVAYYSGSVTWYAKKGTDTKFTVLRREGLNLSGSAYAQLYANFFHSGSIDFLDLQENLAVQVTRINEDGSSRPLDVAFEDSASFLQSDVQIFEEDNLQKLKFDVIEETETFLIQLVISGNEVVIRDSVANLNLGDRLLVNSYARTIIGKNEGARSITFNDTVPGLSIDSSVYKSETIPGKGETLEVTYRPVESRILPLCGTECSTPQSKTTKVIPLDLGQNVVYSTFRQIAEDEVSKVCLPEISGSFEMIIESDRRQNLGLTGIFEDIPQAGQRIRIRTRGVNNNQYDELETVISEVRLESVGHSNGYRCTVTFGEKNDFNTLIAQIKRNMVSQSKIINEDIPEEDLICAQIENISINHYQASLSNIAHRPFRSGLYRGAYRSGLN